MALIKLESFDNPSYTAPADLVSVGGWNAQGGIELGAYNHAGANGIKFTYGNYLRYSGFTRLNPIGIGFQVKITQFATINSVVQIFRFSDSAWDLNTHILLGTVYTSANKFKFRVTDRTGTVDSDEFDINTWYYVTFKTYIHDTAGYFYLYINSNLAASGTERDTKDIGVDGSNWIEFLCTQNTGQIHYIDSVYLLSFSGDSPTDFLASCDVVWDGSTNVIQYSWAEPSVSDDINNWSDSVILNFNYLLGPTDTLDNWDDEIANLGFGPLYLACTDNMYHFYDTINATTIVYHVPLTVAVADSLNSYEDQLDTVSYVQLGADIALEVSDILYLTDSLTVKLNLFVEVADDADNMQDEVALMPGEFLDYAYDTMMYDFLDAIELDFRLHRGISDTMSMSDTISVSLAAYLQTVSVSDNAANLSDAIVLRVSGFKQVSDRLAMYDSISRSMTLAKSISDSLSMSDAININLSTKDASFDDSLDLWNDLVNASMTARLELTISDTMSLSDAVSTTRELGEDLRYYRRYLNDVTV